MSLFAEYKKEVEGKLTIESEDGFVVYQLTNDLCYLVDVYVRPEMRKTKLAYDLASQVEKIAREKGCAKLLGSVVPTLKDSTYRMQVAFSFGFKLQSSEANFIWLEKDLSNG